jgi:hypothetical protein
MSLLRLVSLAFLPGLAIALAACGGGGGGSQPTDVPAEVTFDVVRRDGAVPQGDGVTPAADGATSDAPPPPQCTVAGDCLTKVRTPNQCEEIRCADGVCLVTPKDTGAPCDDFNPCTQFDQCRDGSCVGGTNVCSCEDDDDCLPFDDGNHCNGELRCDTRALPYTCTINPVTIVQCDTSGDTTCRQTSCDPLTGRCVPHVVNVGALCNDDDPCTTDTRCDENGDCTGEEACQCRTNADCLPFEDADRCNAVLFCDRSLAVFVCRPQPGTEVRCPATNNTQCRRNECETATGICRMVNLPDGTGCNDQNGCTLGDQCVAGVCTAGTPKDCDDRNVCTNDGCNPISGDCQHIPNSMSCEDQFACSTGDLCQSGSCRRGEPLRCDDDDPCTLDTCVEPQGCVHTFEPALCPTPDVVTPPVDVVTPPADVASAPDSGTPPGDAVTPPDVPVPADVGTPWPTFATATYRVTSLAWRSPDLCYDYIPADPCVPVTGTLSHDLNARLSHPTAPLVLLLRFEPLDVTADAGLVAVGPGVCDAGGCDFAADAPLTNYGAPDYATAGVCLVAPEVAAPCVATEEAPLTVPDLLLPPAGSGHVNPPVELLSAHVYARFDATFGTIPTGVLRGFLTVDIVEQLRTDLTGFGATELALLFENLAPVDHAGFQGWWVTLTFAATQVSAE